MGRKREAYLRAAAGDDTAAEQAENMACHLDTGPRARPSPTAARPRVIPARRWGAAPRFAALTLAPPERPERSEDGGQRRQPSAGNAGGLPAFPEPLPGLHAYPVAEAVEDIAPLDVGPARPYYSAGMAHGVAAAVEHGGRPSPASGEQLAAQAAAETAEASGTSPNPVPVYIVEGLGAGARPLKRAALRNVPIPAAGGDPVLLVPRNPRRNRVSLLNETAVAGRITADPTGIGGAVLPASMTSYRDIVSEDAIYCYSTGGALVI